VGLHLQHQLLDVGNRSGTRRFGRGLLRVAHGREQECPQNNRTGKPSERRSHEDELGDNCC
jgi:hypothetical protein